MKNKKKKKIIAVNHAARSINPDLIPLSTPNEFSTVSHKRGARVETKKREKQRRNAINIFLLFECA